MALLSVVMLDFGSKTTCESVGGGAQISIVFPPMLALAKLPFSPRKVTRYEMFDSVADFYNICIHTTIIIMVACSYH